MFSMLYLFNDRSLFGCNENNKNILHCSRQCISQYNTLYDIVFLLEPSLAIKYNNSKMEKSVILECTTECGDLVAWKWQPQLHLDISYKTQWYEDNSVISSSHDQAMCTLRLIIKQPDLIGLLWSPLSVQCVSVSPCFKSTGCSTKVCSSEFIQLEGIINC